MKITNKLNLPAGFVKAATAEKHNTPGTLSATTLIQGLKQIILMDRHWEELEDDGSDRIWAIFGSAVHSLLASEGKYEFTEQQMAYKIGGITVTGTIDNYDMQNGVICDYKSAPVNKIQFKNFIDWYLQGMIYAWLLVKNNFPVKKCRFIALLKDHSKTEALRDSQYPAAPVYIYEFPVTQKELFKIGIFIKNKVEEYQRCISLKDNDIPPCSSEERWEKQPKFAVMKNGNKRAVKLFDRKEDADLLAGVKGEKHYVEFRRGESVRCRSYCLCKKFCNFYQKSVIPALSRADCEQAAA
jgi:hypothetical protein